MAVLVSEATEAAEAGVCLGPSEPLEASEAYAIVVAVSITAVLIAIVAGVAVTSSATGQGHSASTAHRGLAGGFRGLGLLFRLQELEAFALDLEFGFGGLELSLELFDLDRYIVIGLVVAAMKPELAMCRREESRLTPNRILRT